MIRLTDSEWALLEEAINGLPLETLTRKEYRQLIGQFEESIVELRKKTRLLVNLREKVRVAYQLREFTYRMIAVPCLKGAILMPA